MESSCSCSQKWASGKARGRERQAWGNALGLQNGRFHCIEIRELSKEEDVWAGKERML
jgi:hypothetical protein